MGRLEVKGIAVKSGVSKNNHKFLPEELSAAVQRSAGKNYPMLKDHEATTDNTIGRVSFGSATVDGNGDTVVSYSGFVIEDGSHITTKISEGIITEVSIGAHADQMVKESEDSVEEIPIGIHFAELSTTPTPAVDGTMLTRASIQNTLKEEKMECPECGKEFKDKESMLKHKSEMHEKAKEESIMAEEKTESTKIDYASEMAKVQEELAKAKLELARRELEQARKTLKEEVSTPSPVSAADARKTEVFEGYIVSRDEDGQFIAKAVPASKLF